MAVSIAVLLRAWRERALLSQEQLAARTGLGVRTIRRLESEDSHRPHSQSVRLLADALRLTDGERMELVAAARGDLDAARRTPRHLPADVPGFVGRGGHLKALDGLLAEGRGAAVVCAIAGTAGVGKTALAVHWAHRVARHFPDGQLYVNLRGFDPAAAPVPPAEALRRLVAALEVPPQRIPTDPDARAAHYRSLLADRRVLILLDNARDADQVRPLLPGAGGCLALVTSRDRLTGLIATEAARPLSLDLLSTVEAWELLASRLDPARLAAEPDATNEIITGCAWLPLALAVVAARAATQPDLPLATLAAELHDASGRLDTLGTGDAKTDVRGALSWSYHGLGEPAARIFRLLGLHPGPDLGVAAAASLAGIPPPRARALLAELTRAHLLTEHGPNRYALHDLLRAYAAEQSRAVDGERDRREAVGRMVDHYLHTAHGADRLLDPDREPITISTPLPGTTPVELSGYDQAMAWFDAERPALVAIVTRTLDRADDEQVCQLAKVLTLFLDRRGHWPDLVAVQTAALEAAQRLGDPWREAVAHLDLGLAQERLGRHDEAEASSQRALGLHRKLGNHGGQANVHSTLCWMVGGRGRHADALRHARRAYTLFGRAGHRAGQGNALNSIGYLSTLLAQPGQALRYGRRALRIFEELGNRYGQAHARDSIAFALHHLGRHNEAAREYRRAKDLFVGLGDHRSHADTLDRLGDTLDAAGDREAARRAWLQALEILDELGGVDTAALCAKLSHGPDESIDARLGALCEQVGRELGIAIAVPPGTTASGGLPWPLRRFYQVADGLVLPFAEVYPHHQVTGVAAHRPGSGNGWVAFGRDPYFCDFLCHADPRPGLRIAVWDREMAAPVEATYADVVDMLAELYAEYLDRDQRADLLIADVPDGVNAAQLVGAVKPLKPMRSKDLLAALRALPATVTDIDCAAGIRAIRTLHRSGISCHLTNIRPRDTADGDTGP